MEGVHGPAILTGVLREGKGHWALSPGGCGRRRWRSEAPIDEPTRCHGALVALLLLAAGAGCGSSDPVEELAVIGTEMAFAAPDAVAPGDYLVRFANQGAVFHELAVKDPQGMVIRRVTAPAGAEATMELSLAHGRYELGCFEPGHYEAGMHRTLSVG